MTLDRCIHLLKNRDFLSLDDYCNEQQQAFEAGRISDVLLSTHVELQNLQRVDLLPIFLEWANSYPQSYMANALAAASLIGVAWEARQNESADRTADYRFEVMAHYLDQAVPLIDRAVALCGVPVMALTSGIQLQASGVIDLEQDYLAEARKLAAKSPLLCRQVMWALNPKWSGDHAALHQFYHEASAFPWSEDQAKLLASSYQLELADLERQHGDYDKALLLLRGAVELYPRTATHEALAEMLNICGMHREAEACYLKAIECGPVARTYFGLGCLRSSSLNDMVGAAQAFEQATRYGHGEAAARWAELHLNFCMADRSSNAALYDKIDFMLQEGMQQYSSTAWFYQAGRYLNAGRLHE